MKSNQAYADGALPRSSLDLVNRAVAATGSTCKQADLENSAYADQVHASRNARFVSMCSKVSETPNKEPSPHILRERNFNRNIEKQQTAGSCQPFDHLNAIQQSQGRNYMRKDLELIDTQLLQASMLNVGDFLPTQNSPEAQSIGPASSIAENFNPKQRYFKQSFLQNLQSIKTTIIQCQEAATFLTNKQSSKLKELSVLRQRQTQLQCQLDSCWQQGRQELGRVRTELAKVDERERRVDQRWLQEESRLSAEIDMKESYLKELRAQYKQQPSFKQSESDPQQSRVESKKMIELKKKQSMIKVQLHHARQAKDKVHAYHVQSREEMEMTREDLVCRERQLVRLVSQREELEQLIESTRSQTGPEYHIYERLAELQGNEQKQQRHAGLMAKLGGSAEKNNQNDRAEDQKRILALQRELDSMLNFQYMTQIVYMFEANNQPISSPTSSVFSSFSSPRASSRPASPVKSTRNVSALQTLQSFLDADRQSLLRAVTEQDVEATLAKIEPPQTLDKAQLREYKRQTAVALEQRRGMLVKLTAKVAAIQEKVNYALSQKSVLRAQIEGLQRVVADCEEQHARVTQQVEELSKVQETLKQSITDERTQLDEKKRALGEQKIQQQSDDWHQMKERDLASAESQIEQLRTVLKKVKGDYETARSHLKEQRQALIDAVDQLSSTRGQGQGELQSESQIRTALQQVDRQLGQVLIEKADIQEQLTGLKAKMREARHQFAQGYKAYRQALGSCSTSIELPKMSKVEQDSILNDTEESLQAVSPKATVLRSETKRPSVPLPAPAFNEQENMKLNRLMANNIFADEMDMLESEQEIKETPPKHSAQLADKDASSPSSHHLGAVRNEAINQPQFDYLLNLRPMKSSHSSSSSSLGRKQPKLSIEIPQNLPDQQLSIINQTEPSPERQVRRQNFIEEDASFNERMSSNTQQRMLLTQGGNRLNMSQQIRDYNLDEVDEQIERTAMKQEVHAVIIEDQAANAEEQRSMLQQQFEESKRLNMSERDDGARVAQQSAMRGLLTLPVAVQHRSPQIQPVHDHEISPADVILLPPRSANRGGVHENQVEARRQMDFSVDEYHEVHTSQGLASSISPHSRETRVSPRPPGGGPASSMHLDQALADSHRQVHDSHRPLMETVQTPCMDQTANMLLYQQDFQNEVFQEDRSDSSYSNSRSNFSRSASRSLSRGETRRQQTTAASALQRTSSLELSRQHYSQGDLVGSRSDIPSQSEPEVNRRQNDSEQDSCSAFAQEVAASNNKHHRVDTFQQQELTGGVKSMQSQVVAMRQQVSSFENQRQPQRNHVYTEAEGQMGEGLIPGPSEQSESASYQTQEFAHLAHIQSAEQTQEQFQARQVQRMHEATGVKAAPNFTSNDSSPAMTQPRVFNPSSSATAEQVAVQQQQMAPAVIHHHKASHNNPMISPTTSVNDAPQMVSDARRPSTQNVTNLVPRARNYIDMSNSEKEARQEDNNVLDSLSQQHDLNGSMNSHQGPRSRQQQLKAGDADGSIRMMLSELLDLQSLQNDLEKLPQIEKQRRLDDPQRVQQQSHDRTQEEKVNQNEQALRHQIRQLLLASMKDKTNVSAPSRGINEQLIQQISDQLAADHHRNDLLHVLDKSVARQYGTEANRINHASSLQQRKSVDSNHLNVSELLMRSGRTGGARSQTPQIDQQVTYQSRSSSSSCSSSSDEDVQPVLGMDSSGQLSASLRQRQLEASMQRSGSLQIPLDASWESSRSRKKTKSSARRPADASQGRSTGRAGPTRSTQKKPVVRRSGNSISINMKTSTKSRPASTAIAPKDYKPVQQQPVARQVTSSFADQTLQIAPQTNFKLLMPPKQTQSAQMLLEPLLRGTNFYKKFSSNGQTTMVTNHTPCFDPLAAERIAPEACGYGLRLLRVDPTFRFIKVTHLLRKNMTESILPIADIARVIIPQQTSEIIKIQRAALSDDIDSYSQLMKDRNDTTPIFEHLQIFSDALGGKVNRPQQSSIQHLAKIGMLSGQPSANNEIADIVVRKCRDTTFYPFSLALKADGSGRLAHKRQPSTLSQQAIRQTGRIDLIATSYDNYFDWVHGLTWIIQHKNDDLSKYMQH